MPVMRINNMIITVILMTDNLLEEHHLMYHNLVYLRYDT